MVYYIDMGFGISLKDRYELQEFLKRWAADSRWGYEYTWLMDSINAADEGKWLEFDNLRVKKLDMRS